MFSKIFKIFIILILLSLTVTLCLLFEYRYTQKNNIKNIKKCEAYIKNPVGDDGKYCRYEKMYDLLAPRFLVYKVKYKGKDITFKTLPLCFIVPYEITADTDAMMGYGVLNNVDAEEMYSSLFKKPAFSFDCGIRNFKAKNPLVHFESSCIATDEFILNDMFYKQTSSGDVHTFQEKLEELNLKNKRIIVKMGISGAEFDALPDILKQTDNVDVITVCFHIFSLNKVLKAIEVLDMLSKDYVLVARTEHFRGYNQNICKCKYLKNKISFYKMLTFVNKKYVDSAYLPWNQTNNDLYKDDYKPMTISKVVVLNQKLKNIKERLIKK